MPVGLCPHHWLAEHVPRPRRMGVAGGVDGGVILSDAGWVNLRMLRSLCPTQCQPQPDSPAACMDIDECLIHDCYF